MGKKNKGKKGAAQADPVVSSDAEGQPKATEVVEEPVEEVKEEALIDLGPPTAQQSEPSHSPQKDMFDDIDDLLDNSILSIGSSIKNQSFMQAEELEQVRSQILQRDQKIQALHQDKIKLKQLLRKAKEAIASIDSKCQQA